MENNLPRGWEKPNLGEVVNITSGNSSLTKKIYKEDGKYIAFSGSGPDGKVDFFEEEGDAVILSAVGARCGKCFRASGKWTTIANTSIIRSFINNSNHIDFLFYLLNNENFWPKGGSGQPFVQTGKAQKETKIPLPPLAEQQRIVTKLDALFEKIESNKKRLDKIPIILKRFRQSVLAAAVTGRLTEVDREVESISLGELIVDLKYGTAQKSEKINNGTPILRIPNIGLDGKVTIQDMKFAVLAKNELDKLMLEEGDILLIRSNGSVSLLGRAAIISKEQIGFAYAGYLIRVRCNRQKLLPEFLIHVLASYDIRIQIELPSRSSSGVNNINSDEVKALKIPSFSIDEQREIVKRILQLFAFADKIEARYNKAKAMLDKVPQSILAKAFRGELVSQNPDDEPASVLLDRINEEKEKLMLVKNTRKKK